MTAEYNNVMNPVIAEFAGTSPGRIAKRLFHATRPKFFPASVLPIIAGTAWGVLAAGEIDVLLFVLALLATVCVHAGSNVLNDVSDEALGTDRINEARIYPYTGGSRFIQTGILNASTMMRLGIGLLAVAAICGAFLLLLKGTAVLWFGLAGVALGVLYSIGPAKLSSLGVGEIAVGVAFGVIPVSGAAWLQGASLDISLLLFSVPISAWVASILLINEVPDIEPDRTTGKNTLPVRFGLNGTAIIYIAMQSAALAVIILLSVQGTLPLLAPLLPIGLLLLAAKAARAIRQGVSDRPGMTKAIESTLAIHTLGSLWLSACVLFYLF
jgi:1,4-dihydroxy-2-naphthoate octaprenyltransferase